jgi:hypothetical protein
MGSRSALGVWELVAEFAGSRQEKAGGVKREAGASLVQVPPDVADISAR